MKRLVLALALLYALLGSRALGEGEYEQIELHMTRQQLEAELSLEDAGEYWLCGDALLAFYESGRLRAKFLNYESLDAVAPLSDAGFDEARKLRQGASIETLTQLLGPGLELMLMNISDEDNAGVRRLLCWKDASGNVLEALLEQEDGQWVLFALGEVRAAAGAEP